MDCANVRRKELSSLQLNINMCYGFEYERRWLMSSVAVTSPPRDDEVHFIAFQILFITST
jgi:hypothetical protein